MPSPIGHALAGIAVVWTADLIPGNRAWRAVPGNESRYQRAGGGLTLLCAGLGGAPDLDLLVAGTHRTGTHSVCAVVCVGLIAAALAARARRPVARLALICAAAYASHLLLDWLGVDWYPPRGIMAFWPISHAWYISDLDIFRQTARLHLFTREVIMINVRAILQECVILLPLLAMLWRIRIWDSEFGLSNSRDEF